MVSNPISAAPVLFDRALLCARQRRALKQGPVTFLLDRVAEDMAERLAAVKRDFADAADIWTPGDALREPLADRLKSFTHVDLRDAAREVLPFQQGALDLVVSALALQFVNDLPGVLAQVRRALKPDGLLLAAMLGGDTLTELRQAFAAAEAEIEGGVSPRVAPNLAVIIASMKTHRDKNDRPRGERCDWRHPPPGAHRKACGVKR